MVEILCILCTHAASLQHDSLKGQNSYGNLKQNITGGPEFSMARGGYRKGAGRKKEYTEPVKKILLGLPESVLEDLDRFAAQQKLSRPKAVALLLNQVQGKPAQPDIRNRVLDELKVLRQEILQTRS